MSDFDGGKQIIATKVTGKVKWYNVKKGYGFIHRDDIDEDVFVHQTAIIKVQPGKNKSLGDDEDVEFDVVKGLKGSEAIKVTGPNGEAVRGSIYASTEGSGYQRSERNMNDNNSPYGENSSSRGRGSYRSRGRGHYNSYRDDGNDDENHFEEQQRPQRGRGGSRGQYSSYQSSLNRDHNYGDEDRGGSGYRFDGRARGRGGSEGVDGTFRGRRPSRRGYGRGI